MRVKGSEATGKVAYLVGASYSNASFVEIRDGRGVAVLTGSSADPLGNVEKDAALAERFGRRVAGEAEIEMPGPEAATPAQELTIDTIRVAPQGSFSAHIDDVEVATFVADERGSVDVELQGVP